MEKNTSVVQVALPLNINSLFSYAVPEGQTLENVIGRRALVNFNNRKLRGYVVEAGEYSDKYQIKPILKVIDKRTIFTTETYNLARWIADYYFAGVGEVLSMMIPKGSREKKSETTEAPPVDNPFLLTPSQQNIYDNIKIDIQNDKKKFYLYGVTGSGKTMIYIKLIEDVLNSGKNAIFLVPEIALSYQTLQRLQERFGSLCALLHSGLSDSQRFGEYLRLLDGKARIAIGPRSALFAPVKDLGIIIIDEENESSYKSEESPRFHARTVAQYIANQKGATLLLGSATPSIESYFYSKNNFFKLYKLTERYGGAYLPDISVIDTSSFEVRKNLTFPLVDEINRRLQNKEQVVLLQNRRGFSNIVKCSDCAEIITCPRCNLYLTYYKSTDKLICRRCNYSIKLPDSCPSCSGSKLIKIGAGTQRIEEEISSVFRQAKVYRMDYDSLKSEKDLKEIFARIENGDINILVGTQIIAKGLHFPNIKFVGIIDADVMLNIPDYKSSERTFALITQVAGRAGREGDKGVVMIQTVNPEHYSIIAAKENDYEKFYNEEIKYRKILDTPPFCRILRLVVRGASEINVNKDINTLSDLIKDTLSNKEVTVMGPSPCQLTKINNNYRYQIILKSKDISISQNLIKEILPRFKITSRNYLEIDVDPTDLF